MSFNRGIKRNSFGNNRPFNRGSDGGGGGNVGGGGGGMGGSGGGNTGNRGVSPWESGVMPPGRGILPTPSNNLSLNSPQAQLVIASNLLSNLLRTQQDSSPPVPSLLSLGNNMNGPGPNFRGQQGFSSPGRFNDRQIRGNNMKSQRSQPYNKMGNRARDGVAGRRGPSSAQQSRAQSQSGNQRVNGNQNQHRNDKNSKANTAKQNQTSKKEQQDVKNSDNEKPNTETVVKSEEKAGEKTDKKSEEKIDKDDDTAMETVPTEEKTADEGKESADKSASPDKKKDDGSGKKSEARHAESRYAAVAISQMFCHVCNKHMWDGFSFENHLRGRAHQLMMDKLDESYKLKVDLMRHELRVSEEQREMSLNNSKRRGKKVSVDLNVREYCTMCDLNFYGTLSSHRKSDKHQQLKTFLHPRCHPCVKEFPSRIEYDEHCLTPTHMVAAAQTEEQKKTKKNKLPKGESEVRTADDEDKDAGPDPKAADKEEELPENTEYLTDITDNMDMTKFKVPSFKYCRHKQLGLGASLLKEVNGFHCEKCRRFMLTQEDMAAHLKTLTHYRNFVNEVKALTAPPPAPEKAEETSECEIKESVENEDGENVAKRPKLEVETEEEIEKESEEKEDETPAQKEAPTDDKDKEDADDRYDPMDADGESEEEKDKTVKEGEENIKKDEDKAADIWEDIDNEDESEVGNLIDGDEKTESVPQTPQSKPQPQNTSTPAITATPSTPVTTTTPSTPAITATPSTPVTTTTPSTPVTTTTPSSPVTTTTPSTPAPATTPATPAPATTPSTPATPSTPTPPEPPIISKTPTNHTPNHQPMNNSGNKNRGGRGFRGGGNRGHQRARRSRR